MHFVDPIYNKEDITKMRRELKRQVNGERNLLCFELCLATAFRIGDALSLRVKDVKSGIIRKRISKTKKEIHLELPEEVVRKINNYIEFMEDDELLFPVNRSTMYRSFRNAAKKIGLENFGTHSVRKTKAYHYYCDSNYNLIGTQQLLGHSDSKDLLRYIGWTKKQLSDSVRGHVL
ncbi:MAG: tyrosine-type recombinase/integrase [Anaerobacillus sp.]